MKAAPAPKRRVSVAKAVFFKKNQFPDQAYRDYSYQTQVFSSTIYTFFIKKQLKPESTDSGQVQLSQGAAR
jgi:hypothetical protein